MLSCLVAPVLAVILALALASQAFAIGEPPLVRTVHGGSDAEQMVYRCGDAHLAGEQAEPVHAGASCSVDMA